VVTLRRRRLAAAREQPRVDLGLERVALLEQRAVAWTEGLHDVVEQRPHHVRGDACAGRDLVSDQIVKGFGDSDVAVGEVVRHRCSRAQGEPAE
jgi:hypothetical protein